MDRPGDFPLPKFNESELDSFLADARAEAEMEQLIEDTYEAEYYRAHAVILGIVRKHDSAIALPEGYTSAADEGADHTSFTLEELETLTRISSLADSFGPLVSGFADAKNSFMKALGGTLRNIEDPITIQAWTSVIKEVYEPFLDVEETMGDDPDVFILQAVSDTEARRANILKSIELAKAVQSAYSPYIESFLESIGKSHHDDAEEFKRNMTYAIQSVLEDKNDEMRAVFLDSVVRCAMNMGIDKAGIGECIAYVYDAFGDELRRSDIELPDDDES